MAQVHLTSEAREDLLDIWDYVADDNPDAADALLRELRSAFQTLAENPLAGRVRNEFAPNMRSRPVGNYVIFYMPFAGGIRVIRVLHGARDVTDLL